MYGHRFLDGNSSMGVKGPSLLQNATWDANCETGPGLLLADYPQVNRGPAAFGDAFCSTRRGVRKDESILANFCICRKLPIQFQPWPPILPSLRKSKSTVRRKGRYRCVGRKKEMPFPTAFRGPLYPALFRQLQVTPSARCQPAKQTPTPRTGKASATPFVAALLPWRRALAETLGVEPQGFCAPAWLINREERAAVAAAGYRYLL